MADPSRSQAQADGTVFGYLGVKITGTHIWTTSRGTSNRCLGPLKGAHAGTAEPRRSWIGTVISSLLLGDVPPKNARLYVTLADGTRYERLVLPWVSHLDWPKIAGEIGRFNAAAYLTHRNSA
jgi:hypothetical protein